MKRILLVLAIAVILVSWHKASYAAPEKMNYQSVPFLAEFETIPKVLLVMAKDHKMFLQAYSDLNDLSGPEGVPDGIADIGFNPSYTYTGYFDSNSCYSFIDTKQRFERIGLADFTNPQATAPQRPAALARRLDIIIPPSKHGICLGSSENGSSPSSTWHGNWLNYAISSRMDVIRKVLYGGKRIVDTLEETVLEPSFVPPDGHVWGIEIASDDLWAEKMPYAPYYNISHFTGLNKPASQRYIFFARHNFPNNQNSTDPYLLVINNINARHQIDKFKTEVRLWDFIAGEGAQPDFASLGYSWEGSTFYARVKVCDPNVKGGISETEGCSKYSTGYYKPTGLLQKYGQDNKMYFGLMTGLTFDDYRRQGGTLRSHVDSMTKAIDYTTGQVIKDGLIDIIDRLAITGWTQNNSWGWGYKVPTAWDNPMGEMLYAATRYFAGSDTTSYARGMYGDEFGFVINYWTQTRPNLPGYECARPIIMMIGNIYPSFDGDDFFDYDPKAINAAKVLRNIKNPPAAFTNNFNVRDYLKLVTINEGYEKAGRKFFYARNATDDCSAKPISNMGTDIKGLCPSEPAREGTYSTVGVAYYAHTHNFGPDPESTHEMPIEVYALAVPDAFPEISFDLGEHGKISVIPASESDSDGKIYGPLKYFVVDWQTDQNGLPFYVKIITIFESAFEGSDYDRDALGTYEISLLAGRGTVSSHMLEDQPLRIHSGPLKDPGYEFDDPFWLPTIYYSPYKYYRFKNYKTSSGQINYSIPKIVIDPTKVAGLSITSDAFGSISSTAQNIGYTISGSTFDGTYMDVSHAGANFAVTPIVDEKNPWPNANASKPGVISGSGIPTGYSRPNELVTHRLTPWSCRAYGQYLCGTSPGASDKMTYYQTRSFLFNKANKSGEFLPNPLWLAAKYGSFIDRNQNGYPDQGEWEKEPGNPNSEPRTYFSLTSFSELEKQLEEAFKTISISSSTGTAASASISSVPGGGIAIQTLYYPTYKDHLDRERSIKWVGSVFALFMDKWGNFREDNYNAASPKSQNGDGKLTLKTGKPSDRNFPTGDMVVRFETGGSDGPVIKRFYDEKGDGVLKEYETVADAQQLKAIWNFHRILLQKPFFHRRIYYGQPKGDSVSLREFMVHNSNDLEPLMLHSNTGLMLAPPPPPNNLSLIENLIFYIIGYDISTQWRSRSTSNPWISSNDVCKPELQGLDNCITWALGDVINSKPIIVGAPSSKYDITYGDESYNKFKNDPEISSRRHVAYFGANDGMLHAVNLGFRDPLSSGSIGYSKKDDNDYELGEELWAYIPTAVLPHLQWLADPDYQHSYYVDMKPLIADVKYDGQWRTILIGGLRLGGNQIESRALSPYSYSEVFALDITRPNDKPTLLWRYSSNKLGLSVGLPTVVKQKDKWYVVLASGPSANMAPGSKDPSPYDGYSNQQARLIVLDIKTGKEVVKTSGPNSNPNYLVVPATEGKSFFNDSFLPMSPDMDPSWSHQTAYYGLTISRDDSTCLDKGAVYRLDMSSGTPQTWKLKRLISVDRPVTGAVNATYDTSGNMWVVFGTGRVWGRQDLYPCDSLNTGSAASNACIENHNQYLYGVKEDLDSKGKLTFKDLTGSRIIDVSGGKVFKCPLTESGYITGLKAADIPQFTPSKVCGQQNLVGVPYKTLTQVLKKKEYAGYRLKLETEKILTSGSGKSRFEMVVTQPKLDSLPGGGSYMAFTSFAPPMTRCGDSGQSYLHVVDTFTGLPSPYLYDIFLPLYIGDNDVENKHQVPGYIEAGNGKATEAIIVKTSDNTMVQTSGQDGATHSLSLPINESQTSSVISWREVLDMGFKFDKDEMTMGLE